MAAADSDGYIARSRMHAFTSRAEKWQLAFAIDDGGEVRKSKEFGGSDRRRSLLVSCNHVRMQTKESRIYKTKEKSLTSHWLRH